MEMSILQIWPLDITRTHTSRCTQALAFDPEAVGGDRFDSGDICRISVQGASLYCSVALLTISTDINCYKYIQNYSK